MPLVFLYATLISIFTDIVSSFSCKVFFFFIPDRGALVISFNTTENKRLEIERVMWTALVKFTAFP